MTTDKLMGKMDEMELDAVVGGVGYCYWMKDGDKYNYVAADRPLSREEVIMVWNHNAMTPLMLPPRTDDKGNVLPGTQNVYKGKGLKQDAVEGFMKRNLERFGGECHYIEFK
ncbi:hypothetical protein [Selenomonas sp. AB3002]|uniref:hypothetical protein n=1 Tax=Selenomonas sp. AB3002 TaxID=1392502 RepID=UPI000495AF6C